MGTCKNVVRLVRRFNLNVFRVIKVVTVVVGVVFKLCVLAGTLFLREEIRILGASPTTKTRSLEAICALQVTCEPFPARHALLRLYAH